VSLLFEAVLVYPLAKNLVGIVAEPLEGLVPQPPRHEHPELVAWLKHTAVGDFYFNGGQSVHMHPDQINHTVYKNQADYLFLPNYFEPYSPLY